MCPPIWSNHGELYIIKLKNKKSYGQKSLKKGKVPGPLNRGYYQFFFIFCRGIDFLENERLVGLVGKTLATTATHRVQPENTTTFLDPARRAKVNTTPQHTYPLTNPISLCQSGYQVIKEGVLPIDAFWHGAKECIISLLSDRDLLPGVVGPGLRKPLWQDRPCTT